MRPLPLAALALAFATPASAQIAEHKSLTIEGARNVIAAAVAFARTRAGTGVIAVVDDGGNLMALERLDGTFAAYDNQTLDELWSVNLGSPINAPPMNNAEGVFPSGSTIRYEKCSGV